MAPLDVYYVYANTERDEKLFDELEKWLKPLEKDGSIRGWHRRLIRGGQEWAREIEQHLKSAQVFFLLLSPDFFASDYCDEVTARALERQRQENVKIIPLLFRPCSYQLAKFKHLTILPRNLKPIVNWSNHDQAFEVLIQQIREALDQAFSADGDPPLQSTAGTSASGSARVEQSASPPVPAPASPPSEAPHCDVLLATVTPVELRAVLAACGVSSSQLKRRHVENNTYYDLGDIGGARTFMVRSEMGTGGPAGALMTISDGIRILQPQAVIMVGIAFGLRPGKQQLGDILVSRQIMAYELQRVGSDDEGNLVVRPRGDRPQASPRLLNLFRDGEIDWEGAPLHFGLVLSGEKVVDNPNFRAELLRLEPEAIGGEMEGAGLYAAALRNRVDWILVKAICDWADGKKALSTQEQAAEEQRQQVAAENAARFVLHVLNLGGLAR